MKKKYNVGLHERYIFWSTVEAEDKEEAIYLARNGLGDVDCDWSEYVETLDIDPEVSEVKDDSNKQNNQ